MNMLKLYFVIILFFIVGCEDNRSESTYNQLVQARSELKKLQEELLENKEDLLRAAEEIQELKAENREFIEEIGEFKNKVDQLQNLNDVSTKMLARSAISNPGLVHKWVPASNQPAEEGNSPKTIFYLSLKSNMNNCGQLFGSGNWSSGWVNISARPYSNYVFDKWVGGSFKNSKSPETQVFLDEDKTLTAFFKLGPKDSSDWYRLLKNKSKDEVIKLLGSSDSTRNIRGPSMSSSTGRTFGGKTFVGLVYKDLLKTNDSISTMTVCFSSDGRFTLLWSNGYFILP